MADKSIYAGKIPTETLPWSEKKQKACLGHLITNESFFSQAEPRLEATWWADRQLGLIYDAIRNFHTQHDRHPTFTELLEAPDFLVQDAGGINHLRALVRECVTDQADIGLDVIREELTEWLHSRLYYQAVEKSSVAYNGRRLKDAIEIVKDAVSDIQEATFLADPGTNWTTWKGDFERQEAELQHALTTGSRVLDRILNQDATWGSLLRGDQTILIAPTNIGKTTCLNTIGTLNAMAGFNVLIINHEDRPDKVKKQAIAIAACCQPGNTTWWTPRQIHNLGLSGPDGQKFIDSITTQLQKQLDFCPILRAGTDVEEVGAIIRQRQEQCIVRTGRGLDMIIDDYPAKLGTQQNKQGYLQRRQSDKLVYEYFSQIALELNCHVLTAVQANREGAKSMKGGITRRGENSDERRLIVSEDVAESYEAMGTAANIISLNRDSEAQARGLTIFNVCKNRTGSTGYAVVCKSVFPTMSHHDALGAVYYRSGKSYSAQIHDLLQQYMGNEVPVEVLERVN